MRTTIATYCLVELLCPAKITFTIFAGWGMVDVQKQLYKSIAYLFKFTNTRIVIPISVFINQFNAKYNNNS